jgi:uncharacterized repeat protein (TIGR01451 family)
MRAKRLRSRVSLAALATAGLVTVAFPLFGPSSVSAMVGARAGTAAAAPQPAANPALSCSVPTIYNVNQAGDLYALNYASTPPADSPATPSTIGGVTSSVNALAISADGLTVYSAVQMPAGQPSNATTTVYVEDVATGTTANFTVPATNVASVNSGGVNPANGYYYYGGWNSGGTTFSLFAFDPTTDTANLAGTITPPGVGGTTYQSGDLTFDDAGNMVDLAGTNKLTATLLSVAGPVPTSGTSPLAFTTLTTTPAGNGSYVGIAFAADSTLYVETSSGALFSVDPNSGTIASLGTQTGFTGQLNDLASCAYNGSLTVQKNIVGRVASTDQFTMTITGGGVSGGNTGTTTGSSTGVQTSPGSVAGPIVGIPGTSYTVTETPASGTGTSLSNYATTWSCTNVPNSSSGVGTTFTLSFPQPTGNKGASVVCTFTNTPASIAVTKTPDPSTTNAAGQTITYSYAVTNSGPVPLTGVTVADTQTSPAGPLTSGPVCVSLTNPTGTCSGSTVATLAAGQVAQFTASYAVSQADMDNGSIGDSATASGTAPSGAAVSATATASVIATQSPQVSLTKSADPTTYSGPDTQITYSYAVTNTGNVTLSGLSAIDCGSGSNVIASLAPAATVICTATYTTTQADVNAGSISNTGTVEASPPSGPDVSDSSPMTVDFVAPSCYSGPWPSVAQGYEVPSKHQSPAGIFIGVEGDSWHFLTHNASGQKVYAGKITTTGTFTDVQGVRLESVDHFRLVNSNTITFRFVTHADDDEVWFTTQCGSQVEFSPLKSNGRTAQASTVFLGGTLRHPASMPVTFVRNS